MDGRRSAFFALLLLITVAGCRQHTSLPFNQWVEPVTPYAPTNSSDNAYDAYALAAADVEAKCGKYLDRNFYTPAMKQQCLALMSDALAKLSTASGRKCLFQFRPHKPGERPLYQKGWRLLGRALVWQIEQAVIDANYPVAV